MRSRVLFFLMIALLGTQLGMAQFNQYKYIVVPKKFDAFKDSNQHQTSTMLKYMLAQRGFNVVYDDAMPEELFKNRCLGLYTDIDDVSGMFTTKLSVVFNDCQSKEVFRTIEGRSKIKDYKEAYKDAMQKAFVSFDGIEYSYQPVEAKEETAKEETLTISFRNDVKTLEEKKDTKLIEQVATPENQTYKNLEPTPSDYVKAGKDSEGDMMELLYAQPTENGYQLVDSTPEIRLRLVRSSLDNLYFVGGDKGNGIVFQKDGSWWLEKIENGEKSTKKLNLKF
nr:hypothetical protein [Allomuricauda sp.]